MLREYELGILSVCRWSVSGLVEIACAPCVRNLGRSRLLEIWACESLRRSWGSRADMQMLAWAPPILLKFVSVYDDGVALLETRRILALWLCLVPCRIRSSDLCLSRARSCGRDGVGDSTAHRFAHGDAGFDEMIASESCRRRTFRLHRSVAIVGGVYHHASRIYHLETWYENDGVSYDADQSGGGWRT